VVLERVFFLNMFTSYSVENQELLFSNRTNLLKSIGHVTQVVSFSYFF